jgi:hypothetical protein
MKHVFAVELHPPTHDVELAAGVVGQVVMQSARDI